MLELEGHPATMLKSSALQILTISRRYFTVYDQIMCLCARFFYFFFHFEMFSGCYNASIKHKKWDSFKTIVCIRRFFALDGRNYSNFSSILLVSLASKRAIIKVVDYIFKSYCSCWLWLLMVFIFGFNLVFCHCSLWDTIRLILGSCCYCKN